MMKMLGRYMLLVVIIVWPTAAFAGWNLSDDFSDSDYTADPSWTVLSGQWAANGTLSSALNPQAEKLVATDPAEISLDFDASEYAEVTFDLFQSHGTSLPFRFGFGFGSNGEVMYQKASPEDGRYGQSSFHNRDSGGNITDGVLSGAHLGRGQTETYKMVFDADAQDGRVLEFYRMQGGNPVLLAYFQNYLNIDTVDSLYFKLYDSGPGDAAGVTYQVDNVNLVGVVPEPATIALLGLGGLCALRRRRP